MWFMAVAFAGGAPLTPAQDAWLRELLERPLAAPAPVGFFGLAPTLDVYADPALSQRVAALPAVPQAVGGPGDYGGNLGGAQVLEILDGRWRVDVSGTTGWIRRSAVRADTLVVARPDGAYVRDLFPSCVAGGSRCGMRLSEVDGRPVVLFRYVDSYRGDGERWFALALDLDAGRFTRRIEPPPPPKEAPLSSRLGPEAAARLADALGFGRTGFAADGAGGLVERAVFYAPLTAEVPAAAAGDWVLFSSSIFPESAPQRL